MVPLLAALVYRNRPQVSEVAGVLVATAGLGLMTLEGRDRLHRPGRPADVFLRHRIRRAHRDAGPLFRAHELRNVIAGPGRRRGGVVFVTVLVGGNAPLEWRPAVVWAILVTGLLATALAFTIQAWAQQYTTSTRTALIYMLEPVFAWMTSYCIGGRGPSGRAAAGAALILGGVVLVELKPLNPRLHPSSSRLRSGTIIVRLQFTVGVRESMSIFDKLRTRSCFRSR